MAWQDILDAEIIPGKPPKSSIFFRLRDNLEAVAKRLTGAWIVQVPVTVYLTSGTVWNIPDGVTAWEEELVGGGGGSTAGGATTTTYDGLTVTAGGGTTGITGGTATNGDLNLTGFPGLNGAGSSGGIDFVSALGGDGPFGLGQGGRYFASAAAPPTGNANATGYGAGRSRCGAGAGAKKRRVRVPGQDSVTYAIGAAGTGGAPGILIIRY